MINNHRLAEYKSLVNDLITGRGHIVLVKALRGVYPELSVSESVAIVREVRQELGDVIVLGISWDDVSGNEINVNDGLVRLNGSNKSLPLPAWLSPLREQVFTRPVEKPSVVKFENWSKTDFQNNRGKYYRRESSSQIYRLCHIGDGDYRLINETNGDVWNSLACARAGEKWVETTGDYSGE